MNARSTTTHRSGPVRSDDARLAILRATAEAFLAKGYDGLTIQGVAATAQVGKQTIYRWWGGKAELVADCLVEGLLWDPELVVHDTGDVVRDVTAWLGAVMEVGPTGANDLLRSLLGAAAGDETLAARLDALLRGDQGGGLTSRLRVARGRGEVSEEVDIVLATDLLLGLVTVRAIARRPLDPAELAPLVRQLLSPR